MDRRNFLKTSIASALAVSLPAISIAKSDLKAVVGNPVYVPTYPTCSNEILQCIIDSASCSAKYQELLEAARFAIQQELFDIPEMSIFEIIKMNPGECPVFSTDLVYENILLSHVFVQTKQISFDTVVTQKRYYTDGRFDIVLRKFQMAESTLKRKLLRNIYKSLISSGDPFVTHIKNLTDIIKNASRQMKYKGQKLTDLWGSFDALEAPFINSFGQEEWKSFVTYSKKLSVYGVNIHISSIDTAPLIALDQSKSTFVAPLREELSLYQDFTFSQQRSLGFYGWLEIGFGVLDPNCVILIRKA